MAGSLRNGGGGIGFLLLVGNGHVVAIEGCDDYDGDIENEQDGNVKFVTHRDYNLILMEIINKKLDLMIIDLLSFF